VRVVRVELRAEGRVGYGEAKPLARYGESVDSALAFLADLAPRVAEASPAEIVGGSLDASLDAAGRARELAARAALDAAAHDLAGKIAGRPVWELLGLPRTSRPTSFTVSLDDPDAMARVAER